MNKNVNKKNKDNFFKWLLKEGLTQKEKKGLKLIGCTMLCLTFFLTGLYFGSNSAGCYTNRKQAIELVKQNKGEFGKEYDSLLSDILDNYYYGSTYDIESCQVTYELGIITEMIINGANKDIILRECDLLMEYMYGDSDNLVNVYRLKQLIMEKY